eukprot:13982761-Alexandrium_andersonii.AAC.1
MSLALRACRRRTPDLGHSMGPAEGVRLKPALRGTLVDRRARLVCRLGARRTHACTPTHVHKLGLASLLASFA